MVSHNNMNRILLECGLMCGGQGAMKLALAHVRLIKVQGAVSKANGAFMKVYNV